MRIALFFTLVLVALKWFGLAPISWWLVPAFLYLYAIQTLVMVYAIGWAYAHKDSRLYVAMVRRSAKNKGLATMLKWCENLERSSRSSSSGHGQA